MIRIVLISAIGITAGFALAQDTSTQTPDEERSFFVGLLEDQLSTPNRIIRINGIEGVLSSEATIGEITIADREGVWLRIEDASIDWSRTTLIVRQRLDISRLSANSIEVLRKPLPDENALPSPESTTFSIPELPIAINLGALEIPKVTFGENVFGLASVLAVKGRIKLEQGTLDSALDVTRMDGPGGKLALVAAYANATSQLELDLNLSEPKDGVLANLLNIENRPPLSLTVQGSGPLENLDVALALRSEGNPALEGKAQFRGQPDGLGFNINVGGPVSMLIPNEFRGFFGNDTRLQAAGVSRKGGGLLLSTLTLSSAALSVSAAAETASDGFLTALSLDAAIADPLKNAVLLPIKGGDTSLQSARMTATYGEAGSTTWQAKLSIDGLRTAQFAARDVTALLNGQAQNLTDPTNRQITYKLDAALNGISAEDPEMHKALGETVKLTSNGLWRSGNPLALTDLELAAHSFVTRLSGDIKDFAYNGDITLEAEDIAPFSGLADRDLNGGLRLSAHGKVQPISGAFNLALDGTGSDLRISEPTADALLVGSTRLTGRLARSDQGFEADNFRINNEQLDLKANGILATETADFRFDATITDIALLTDRASGPLSATGTAKGDSNALALNFVTQAPKAKLLDRNLTEAKLGFNGEVRNRVLTGTISGDAFLDGTRASLQSNLHLSKDGRKLDRIDFSTSGSRVTGGMTQDPAGLVTGKLVVDAADISIAAALFLTNARGAINADIALEPRDNKQHVTLNGKIRDLVMDNVALKTADIQANVADLFGVPAIQGTIAAEGLDAAGISVTRLSANATSNGSDTAFDTTASLKNGTDVAARGSLAPEQNGFRLGLDELSLRQNQIAARLLSPVSLLMANEKITFTPLKLDIAGGRVTAEGSAGETFDIALSLAGVPLSIANSIRPDLGLGGTVDGSASIGGTRDTPQVHFDLRGNTIRAAALHEAGVSTLDLSAKGNTDGNALSLNAQVSSPDGLRANVDGTVPLKAGELGLTVDLKSFPLALLNRQVPNQNLGGTLTGNARIAGTLAAPRAEFNIQGSGLAARQLTEVGASPLTLNASGSFAGETLQLHSLTANGPSGLTLTANGAIPLKGNGLSVNARGNIPLALGNRLLIDRGTQLSGAATADIQATGSLSNLALNGSVTASGASVLDPLTNLRLNDVRVDAVLNGNQATIRNISANIARGGTLAVSGTISTVATAGFPADLAIRLNQAKYTDGQLMTATVDGAMRLAGPLTRDPLLSGNIKIDRAEITVPDNLSGGAASIDVKHINPPLAVVQTLERARANDGTPMPGSRPSVMRLDLAVDAPTRIFIRGRGLDAEVGGSVRLTGPITSVQPVGGFRLIRGRLGILGQRIVLSEGTMTLTGDLDPDLNFVATSDANGINIIISVRGRVSDLKISFSSDPTLPEDEVLSQLIFNRSIDDLSPLQLAQLAVAAAELAGGSNTSLLGSLRNATGLDELDVVTDAQGNLGVRAGRYIQENIYLGVETGASGSAKATINLDLTEHLRIRGSTDTEGDTGGGIFYEKDY